MAALLLLLPGLLLKVPELRLLLLGMVLHLLLLLLHVGHARHGGVQSHISTCTEGERHGEVVPKEGGREKHTITTPTTGATYSSCCCCCYTGCHIGGGGKGGVGNTPTPTPCHCRRDLLLPQGYQLHAVVEKLHACHGGFHP